MISLNEIRPYYPEHLQGFTRFMMREYLQYKILEIIFESAFANKLCFLGGTCLRIVHNNTRFSEDLDFDNFNLSPPDFDTIAGIIQTGLKKQGYTVEIKNVIAGAFHCYIKFTGILFSEGIAQHEDEKILIRLDTEPQAFKFIPKRYILNKFDVFTSIQTTPEDVLLSQKFFALMNRKRKKGRDFFDIVFLLKTTRPNYDYLKQKLNIDNETDLIETVLDEIADINLREMANDVQDFLFNPKDINPVLHFKEFLIQVFNR